MLSVGIKLAISRLLSGALTDGAMLPLLAMRIMRLKCNNAILGLICDQLLFKPFHHRS